MYIGLNDWMYIGLDDWMYILYRLGWLNVYGFDDWIYIGLDDPTAEWLPLRSPRSNISYRKRTSSKEYLKQIG